MEKIRKNGPKIHIESRSETKSLVVVSGSWVA